MTFAFKLPDIGEGVVEGEIVKWLVAVGEAIDVDQPLVEIMTDKATVVIPSPVAGTIGRLCGNEGDFVAVGAVLLEIHDALASEGKPSVAPTASEDLKSAAADAPSAALDAPSAALVGREGPRVLAAPATRRLARDLGVDLSLVSATGPAGRVTSEDVRKASAKAKNVATPALIPSPKAGPAVQTMGVVSPTAQLGSPALVGEQPQDEVMMIRGVRRRIWEGMTRSAFSAPHFTFVEECEVTKLIEARKALNAFIAQDEQRLTFLPFIVKAVCVALRDFPELNGHVDEEKQAFIRRADIHVGLAVAAEQGLTVPVIRNADRLSLKALAAQIRRIGDAVRSGEISSSDLGGSTFTVTSLGREGGLFATPILNHPEVGILGVHRLQKRLVQDEDERLYTQQFINLSLSCDHRLIDGHIAARFAYRVIKLLSEPNKLYLEMS